MNFGKGIGFRMGPIIPAAVIMDTVAEPNVIRTAAAIIKQELWGGSFVADMPSARTLPHRF